MIQALKPPSGISDKTCFLLLAAAGFSRLDVSIGSQYLHGVVQLGKSLKVLSFSDHTTLYL